MAVHRIKNGLDLPISGAPEQSIHEGPGLTRVALLGDDYPGLRARVHVAEGDDVARGQLLFEDRTAPGVRFTAPGAGRVTAINRGHRRALRSLVIQLSGAERSGGGADAEHAPFQSHRGGSPDALGGEDVRALLVESGLWTAFRTRPFRS